MIYLATISFALGILIAEFGQLGISLALFVFIVGGLVALIIQKENQYIAKIILLSCLFLAIGILRMSWAEPKIDKELLTHVGEKVTVLGKIADEPDWRDSGVRYVAQPENSASKILLVVNNFSDIEYGDKIKFSGRLDRPKNFVASADEADKDNNVEFDYVSFLAKDQIHFTIWNPEIEIVAVGQGSLISKLYDLKNVFVSKIATVVPEPNSSLLAGLIFGVKQSLGSELLEKFRQVGLIHIVVLSGYNLGIIAYAVLLATSYFGKRNAGLLASGIFIILFAFMVGLGATVVRAGIMALLAILARFLGRPAKALRWLFIAGALMLLWNPLSLSSDPSFQLSFMATLGLILFSPFFYSLIAHKFSFIPEKFALREIIAATFAVQIFILPLLIKMSGEISLVSFLVNPLVLPVVPIVMALGALTGFAGALPFIGKIISWPFGALAFIASEFIIRVVEIFSALSFAVVPIGTLPLYVIIIWYAFYAYVYYKLKNLWVS